MLLTTMTPAEITAQVKREYHNLSLTTIPRLVYEYDRERRKCKIDKSAKYCKDYHIRTAGKNNWIICIGKSTACPRYTGPDTSIINLAVYYHTEKGIRAISPCYDDRELSVYNGHFFSRYNERLQLNLSRTVDVIVHFLKNDRECCYHTSQKKKESTYRMGFCKNGMLLGEYEQNEKYNWLIWKTFVSRDLTRADQEKMDEQLIKGLFIKLDIEMKQNYPDISHLKDLKNAIQIITGLEVK